MGSGGGGESPLASLVPAKILVFAAFCKISVKILKNPVTFAPPSRLYIMERDSRTLLTGSRCVC
jgi:hypothetical protein